METIQSLHETAKEVLGEKYKRQSRETWWTEEIEGLIETKKNYIRNVEQKEFMLKYYNMEQIN